VIISEMTIAASRQLTAMAVISHHHFGDDPPDLVDVEARLGLGRPPERDVGEAGMRRQPSARIEGHHGALVREISPMVVHDLRILCLDSERPLEGA
jgi:hypothetical protein